MAGAQIRKDGWRDDEELMKDLMEYLKQNPKYYFLFGQNIQWFIAVSVLFALVCIIIKYIECKIELEIWNHLGQERRVWRVLGFIGILCNQNATFISLFRFDVFHQILPHSLIVSPAIMSYSRRRDVVEVLTSEPGA